MRQHSYISVNIVLIFVRIEASFVPKRFRFFEPLLTSVTNVVAFAGLMLATVQSNTLGLATLKIKVFCDLDIRPPIY